MRLTDILREDCVKVPLEREDKHGAIDELVDLLTQKVGIASPDEMKKAVWQRESTRTTGIGHGVGIPHGKTSSVQRLCMAVGKLSQPIDFGSIDNQPVDLIILLASPADQTGPHIQALAKISRMLTDQSLRNALKNAASPADLYQLIADHETKAAV